MGFGFESMCSESWGGGYCLLLLRKHAEMANLLLRVLDLLLPLTTAPSSK